MMSQRSGATGACVCREVQTDIRKRRVILKKGVALAQRHDGESRKSPRVVSGIRRCGSGTTEDQFGGGRSLFNVWDVQTGNR